MKIVFFDIKPYEQEYLESRIGQEFERYYTNSSLNLEFCVDDNFKNADVISVFANSDLSKKVLDKFPNLKYIILRSSGYSYIDLLCAKERGIKVFRTPHYADFSIAEYVFALLFKAARNIEKSNLNENQTTGFELKGKTIGIIGLGAIGEKVYNIARAFDMNPVYFDIHKKEGFDYVEFDELCEKSDIISINCSLTCESLYMIDAGKFSIMKDGVVIINVSRGEIIKTEDLYNAIVAKKVGFAALDTVEGEYFHDNDGFIDFDNINKNCLKNFYLTKMLTSKDNVIITRHAAYSTTEAKYRTLDITLENIKSLTKFTNGAKNHILV